MADWDDDSATLQENLKRVLREVRTAARERHPLNLESVRHWQAEIMQGLDLPDPGYIGAFRGESGLENIQLEDFQQGA
jgi:hypothetical protein